MTNYRILIIDDELGILDLLRESLKPDNKIEQSKADFQDMVQDLFNDEDTNTETPTYDITTCSQGEEGVEEIKKSVTENRPYSMVFLDMRMPPGKDGLWTAQKIREYDQMVNILIMTAYIDVDPAEISVLIPPKDKLLYTQKPLRPQEIRQFAAALCEKWRNEKDLFEANIKLFTSQKKLEDMYAAQSRKFDDTTKTLATTQKSLDQHKKDLSDRETELNEKAIAMKVLMKDLATDQIDVENIEKELDEKILLNIKELTEPFLNKLSKTDLDEDQLDLINILRTNLDKVTSPAMRRLYSTETNLTPSEIQVANLIKQGKTTKQIANLLNLSTRTIEFHRDNIRKKLGITDRKINLKSIIQSL